MKNYKLYIALATLFTLTGCGSSGGDNSVADSIETITGQFRDTYVAGLNYKCSSGKKGLTNAEGEYTCNVGDTVEFSLGGYSLGSATASEGVVTPRTLYPGNPVAEVNVAQLLQSLDTDPTNGIINIPEDFTALDDVDVPPTAPTFDTNMTTVLQNLETGAKTLVTEAVAVAHLQETYSDVLTDLVKGKTFYSTIDADMNTLESFSFNANATSSTWTELIGGSCQGTGSLTIHGMDINFTSTADSCRESDIGEKVVLAVKEIKDDYILVAIGTSTPQRLYFDEDKARAYFLADTLATKNLLAGKTVYVVEKSPNRELSKIIFSSNMSSATWNQIIGGNESGTDTVSINGQVITLGGDETITISEITDDYLVSTYREEDDGQVVTKHYRIYFDEAKARTYLGTTANNLTTYLAGKTFYSTIDDRIKTLESWSFNEDATTSTWIELEGEGHTNRSGQNCTGTGTITTNGMNISFTSTSDNCTDGTNDGIGKTEILTVTEIKDDYVSIAIGDNAPQRLFFTEAKAREFYITKAVENYFVGQTRYFANTNQQLGVRTYSTDGTYTGTVGTSSFSGTYTVNGDTLTLNNSDASRTLILTHQGYDYNGEQFSINITNADGSQANGTTYQYRSAANRNDGVDEYLENHQ